MTVPTLEELQKLPLPERLALVEALWDSIADDSAEVPVTSYQARVLDERLEAMESDPLAGCSWEEFRKSHGPRT